jgi:hypothetical protein
MANESLSDLDEKPPIRGVLEWHWWRTLNQLDEIGKAMLRSTTESEDDPGKLIEAGDKLLVRLRRIGNYLGIQWKLPAPWPASWGIARLPWLPGTTSTSQRHT